MHTIRNKQGANTDNDFWDKYGSTNPRMATFVKITPKAEFGGAANAKGFTSNTRNMTLPEHSITFKSTPGIMPTAVEIALDEPVNLEMMGIYNSDFPHDEVIAGKWNFALVEVFVACWDNVDLGEFVLPVGYTGELKDYQSHFKTQINGKMSLLSNEVNKVTSRLCRVKKFGDAECKKDLNTTVTISGTAYNITQTPVTVASVTDSHTLVFTKLAGTANDPPDEFFRNGEIIALGSTANGSLSREIKSSDTQSTTIVIKLKRKFPKPVQVGHTFTLIAGCDRTIEDCMKFVNIINRRAEDYVPGIETVNRVPSAN